MSGTEKLALQLVQTVDHVLRGNGPASMTITQRGSREPACVVFVVPAPAGPLIDEFLHKLYRTLGWPVAREGEGGQ
jgi:hypothetical protein